jgi:hypothetical protein
MIEKKPLSHIGGHVEPATNEHEINEVDLTKRYKDWQEGYTVPKDKKPGSEDVE